MTEKYIRLDDVMTIIARKHLFKDKTDFDKCIHTIAEQIKALDTIEAEPHTAEWISVKDRLPEKNDCYLVTFNFESNGNPDNGIGVVEFYDGNFYSNGFGVNEDVAAWYSNPVPLSPYRRYRE